MFIGCSCIWCDYATIPWKESAKGKTICSMKCLKEMKDKNPELNYTKEDVWIKKPIHNKRKKRTKYVQLG